MNYPFALAMLLLMFEIEYFKSQLFKTIYYK